MATEGGQVQTQVQQALRPAAVIMKDVLEKIWAGTVNEVIERRILLMTRFLMDVVGSDAKRAEWLCPAEMPAKNYKGSEDEKLDVELARALLLELDDPRTRVFVVGLKGGLTVDVGAFAAAEPVVEVSVEALVQKSRKGLVKKTKEPSKAKE